MKTLLALVLLLLATPLHAQDRCTGQTPCLLGDRSYHVLEPDGWDGVTPMPVLLHFHGWGRQGTLIVQHGRIAGHTRLRNVLLVAPNGLRGTWDFRNADSRDVDFADAVLADVAARYPIDPERIFISGYSFGGAMAWRYTCQSGNDVRALLAVAGSIRQSTQCPEAPGEARHVHGTDDTVMRFPFGPQGETEGAVALWRARYDCGPGEAAGQWQVVDFLVLTRSIWTDCAGGAQVTLDIHPNGHFIPHGWIGRQLDEILGRTPTYP